MNTAVRRLLIIACVASAVSLSAQTKKKTTTSTPQPMTVTTDPVRNGVDVPQADQAPTVTVSADTDKDVNNPRAVKLSLDDAVHAMLQKNIGVQIQRYDLLMSGEQVLGAYGIFDPFASATLSRTSSDNPALTAFDASGGGTTNANASIRDTIPTGGTLSISTTNQRFTRSGAGTTISPGFSTGLGFGFTQPLARNFGVDVTRRGITLARNTLGINRELFRSVLLDSTSAVEQAYYDLIYARRFVDVVKEALFLARDQSRITQIRIDVGASAPLDILQPRVQIATGEENLITAVANVRAAEDRLRALLNLPPEDWDRPIIPTDQIGYTPMTINVEESVARAYDLRPEIKENQLTTASRRVVYQYARNQVLPQFDLNLATTSPAPRAGWSLRIPSSTTRTSATRWSRFSGTSFRDGTSASPSACRSSTSARAPRKSVPGSICRHRRARKRRLDRTSRSTFAPPRARSIRQPNRSAPRARPAKQPRRTSTPSANATRTG